MNFFDTNILVYAVSTDETKREIAQKTLLLGGCVSVQVLNEFANVLRAKQKRAWSEIEATLDAIERWFETIKPLTLATHRSAVALARDHSISLYDALIVAAAIEADCRRLYSEDLQDGRRFASCVIVNPFLAR